MEYGVTVLATAQPSMLSNANPLENPNISLRDPQVWQATFGGGETMAGVSVTPTTALGYPPLWRAINLVAGDVAKLPLNVHRRLPDGGKLIEKKHPAWTLLNRKASETADSMSFKECLTAQALLRGNGYAAIQRNNRLDPVELLYLDPSETFPVMSDGKLFYVTYIDGEPVRLRSHDVLHLRGLASDGLVGYDLVTLMADALGVGMAAQRFGARFFGQGANMSGILMMPGRVDQEKLRNTMSDWDQMATGLNKAHKVALLQDGVKFQQMTIAPDQAQFLQTRQYEVRATVANIIGCPAHKLGDDTRTSYSSLEAENQSYLDECLDRWLKKWEVECGLKLLSETQKRTDTHFVEFNRKALLRMSAADRANYYSRLQEHGNLTVNDVLRAENMPTIGEKGNRRYRPANLMEIGEDPDVQAERNTPEPVTRAENGGTLLKALVESSVGRAVQIERDRVTKAAKTEANFVEWMDQFYVSWIRNSSTTAETEQVFTRHAAESKHQLLDVAGSATQTSLAGAVADCVATWSDRGKLITTTLLGADHGGN